MSLDIAKQYVTPNSAQTTASDGSWDHDIVDDEESEDIDVDIGYSATEKLVGYMTIGIGQNRVNVDDLTKGDNMDNLKKLIDWTKDEAARRKEHESLTARPDIGLPQIDYDDSVDWESLHTEQSSDDAKDIKPKDLHNPLEG